MNLRRFWRSRETEAAAHPVRAEVLVVEDQNDQAELLSHLLRLQGAVVTRASNLAGALEVLNGPLRFQIALVDLRLPGGSGVEVVRLIKERRPGTHPVIITGSPDLLMTALDFGYISVILKPWNVGVVRDMLRAHRLPYTD
jgi:two-component system LytT family response regulator/two-component system response regulator LytT